MSPSDRQRLIDAALTSIVDTEIVAPDGEVLARGYVRPNIWERLMPRDRMFMFHNFAPQRKAI
jgi:hypothetical protein